MMMKPLDLPVHLGRPAPRRWTSLVVGVAFVLLTSGANPGAHAAVHPCDTTQELWDALAAVQPGDDIVLTPGGTYYADTLGLSDTGAHFASYADGTASQRITLRTSDPTNPAVLVGENPSSLTVLRIFGDYWTVRDIAVTNAQKGIIFDHANYGIIKNCEVFGIGYEAIHIRDGSDHCLVEECYVHDTGIRSQGYGEAIYVGTDKGSWSKYDPYVSGTTIRNNTLGPNVAAECLDIKEGTDETVVEYNHFDATGLSGSNYADSFIDLKGTRSYIRYNTFVRNGEPSLTKGIAVIYRSVELSAYEHAIHDNYFYLDDDPTLELVASYSGSSDVYAWNNVREPNSAGASDGDDYASLVVTECCPPWYAPPDDGTFCTAPYNLAYVDVTNTSAALLWTGSSAAISFDVRYKKIDAAAWDQVLTTAGSSLVIGNLQPQTVHSWQVVASCASGPSTPAAGSDFITLSSGGNDPPVPPGNGGAEQIYTDELLGFWNDYSFGGTYDLDSTEQIKVGSRSIKCEYSSYGGLNLKRSPSLDSTADLAALRFWARGDPINGLAGDPTIRLEVDDAEWEFDISNSAWQIFEVPLTEVGSPSTIETVRFQSRQSANTLAYFDQIEFVLAADGEPTMTPTVATSASPTSGPTGAPGVAPTPTGVPSGSPTSDPTSAPVAPTTTASPSASPSFSPTDVPTGDPTSSPTSLPVDPTQTALPTSAPSLRPTTAPTKVPVVAPPTPSPVSGPSLGFVVYGDSLASGWSDYSYKGSYDLASSDQVADGALSIRADFLGYGALNLKRSYPGVDVAALTHLRFWVRAGGGHTIRVRVNGKMVDVPTTSGVWEQKSMPLSGFQSPSAVYQLEIQHRSGASDAVYFDQIELVAL